MNLAYYLACLALIANAALCFALAEHRQGTIFSCTTAALTVLWIAGRAMHSHMVRLAQNASRVLRIMTHAASKRAPGRSEKAEGTLRGLLRSLPWLGTYDRRDIMVVQDLLDRLHPEQYLPSHTVHALAFSAYWGARLQRPSSAGNGDALNQSLRDWLKEKDVTLRQGKNLSSSQGAEGGGQEAAEAKEIVGVSWLDGGDGQRSAGDPASRLPLSELKHFGWVVASQAQCGLFSPFGAIVTNPPDTNGVWTMGAALPFDRAKLYLITPFFFFYLCRHITFILYYATGTHDSVYLGHSLACLVPNAIFVITNIMLALIMFGNVLRADLRLYRSTRRLPFPTFVFNETLSNFFASTAMVIQTVVLGIMGFLDISEGAKSWTTSASETTNETSSHVTHAIELEHVDPLEYLPHAILAATMSFCFIYPACIAWANFIWNRARAHRTRNGAETSLG